MKNNFIIFNNYQGFKNYENILMSLIVGLDKSKLTICFSNGYAALKCGVSTRTITDTISKFVEKGYIKCFYNDDNTRIIHLKNTPKLIDDIEVCGIEDTTTPIEDTSIPIEHTTIPIEHTTIPMEDTTIGIELTSNNNIEDNIEDNIEYNIDNNIEHNIEHNTALTGWNSEYRKLVKQFMAEGYSKEEAVIYAKDALILK